MEFKSFDGVDVSRGEDIEVRQLLVNQTEYAIDHQYQRRSRQHPVLEDVLYQELRIPFRVKRRGDATHDDIMALFSVYDGFRPLVALEGETEVSVSADVARFQGLGNDQDSYEGVFVTAGVFEATSESGPHTTSPLTVEGSLFALPQITITSGGVAATRHRYSIRDRTGRGLKAWDLRVQHDASEVWVNGASIPFAVVGGYTWFRVGVRHDRPTIVDVITGGANSPTRNQLDTGTMVLAESTNTQRKYSGWKISRNPGGASNQWRPGITEPVDRSAISITYGVDNEFNSSWSVRLNATRVERYRYAFANDYLSAVFTSPVEIVSISGLERYLDKGNYTILSADGSIDTAWSAAKAAVRYRTAHQEEWESAWEVELISKGGGNTTAADTIEVPDALQVSVTLMVPPMGVSTSTSVPITFYQHHPSARLILSGNPIVTYDAAKVPEITLQGSTTGRIIDNGTLTNETTNEEIRFDRVYFDADGLLIDCNKLDINAVAGMHYGKIRETDPAHLFKLVPGDNDWTVTGSLTGATVSFTWRERHVL